MSSVRFIVGTFNVAMCIVVHKMAANFLCHIERLKKWIYNSFDLF